MEIKPSNLFLTLERFFSGVFLFIELMIGFCIEQIINKIHRKKMAMRKDRIIKNETIKKNQLKTINRNSLW